jgi:3-carboxy-cis,cis-muconate cycloisomerase
MRPSSSRSERGSALHSEIFSGLFDRGASAAQLDDRAWLRAMLDFEAALAAAGADVGLVPAPVAREIARVCEGAELDPALLGAGTAEKGTPVPALLEALTPLLSADAAAHLHRGATSQDVVDTATMLLAKRALAPLLEDLDVAADACATLADRHRDTLQVGRTLLQQALPVTFGLTAAGWLVALEESGTALAQVRTRCLALQLGGGAGTLASLGERGVELTSALARRLDLVEPTLPWHSDRMRPALLAGALGACCGVGGKIATDVVLLAQTELAELADGSSDGGSSTLPHKRNPVAAVAVRACAQRAPGLVATMFAAMGGELQRAAGSWQAEARTLMELLGLTGSAMAALRSLLECLQVNPQRMRANLELTGGLIMGEAVTSALTEHLGRARANELVQQASREARVHQTSLRAAVLELPEIVSALAPEGIDAALDPRAYLGSTEELIERALARHRARTLER